MENVIKQEIHQILDKLPENTLKSVLTYLKTLDKLNQENQMTGNLVHKILNEDANLLKRLAQ